MINFRFHLVSLVAVFLAIGVGVAMGASFVDRATVDNLRGRLDDLETNYRERGGQIEELRTALRSGDEAMARLLDEDSSLLAGRLVDRPVVVVAPASVGDDALDATWQALAAADATRSGTLRLEPSLDLSDEPVLAQVRDIVGLDSATPQLVRGRLLMRLGTSLAALSATEPIEGDDLPSGEGATPPSVPADDAAPAPTTTPTTTTPPFRPEGPRPTVEEIGEAREFLRAILDTGVVSFDDRGVTGSGFPDVAEATYVVLLPAGADEPTTSMVHRVVSEMAASAPAIVTVAESVEPRSAGEPSTLDPERVGSLLVPLRRDAEVADRLSTVDLFEDRVGRAVLVLAVEEQLRGRVGHYGLGSGATAFAPPPP